MILLNLLNLNKLNSMKSFSSIVNDSSALIAFLFASFPQFLPNLFDSQFFETPMEIPTAFYPFFSSIFLIWWAKLKLEKPSDSKLLDISKLIATAINLLLITFAISFLLIVYQYENSLFPKTFNFVISFFSAGLLLAAAISQTARVVETMSNNRIFLYFGVNVAFALLASSNYINIKPFLAWTIKPVAFSLLYLIIHFPSFLFLKNKIAREKNN